MTLATVDEQGRPDVRTLMLHDADERGWHFASHATSAKGRQLAAHPEAALGFYWAAQGRQIRIRGRVTRGRLRRRARPICTPARRARWPPRSPAGRARSSARQEELATASQAAWERAQAEPDAPVPTWTLYVLQPYEVEFFQGDERRRHVRLRYRARGRAPGRRELLWP